jgi:hypothetical protein
VGRAKATEGRKQTSMNAAAMHLWFRLRPRWVVMIGFFMAYTFLNLLKSILYLPLISHSFGQVKEIFTKQPDDTTQIFTSFPHPHPRSLSVLKF